jgi:hypothetical protein
MRNLRSPAALGLLAALAASAIAAPTRSLPSKEKITIPAVRWDEERLGCTFSRGDDGKYYYGLWSGDVGIILGIDSQELEKVHRRHEP